MGDLKNRITRAHNTFTKLGNIWNNNKITRKTKIKLFKTLETPVLLYGCETWKMNKGDNKLIDMFQKNFVQTCFHSHKHSQHYEDIFVNESDMKVYVKTR